MKANRIGFGLVMVVALVATIAGCHVGEGTGAAKGTLYVENCTAIGQDYGSLATPKAYDLDPGFFAGEPIEDIQMNGSNNRLQIRLQSSGKRLEVNDQLVFDILSMYQIALCVHGGDALASIPDAASFCYWAPGATYPRIRIGPDMPIRVNFVPRATCSPDTATPIPQNSTAVATAIDSSERLVNGQMTVTPPDQWESWIELADFGKARSSAVGSNFKVEYGERLHAEMFHLKLTDDRVVYAEKHGNPVPVETIKGELDGFFDFDLERGQGAQIFP